MMFPKTAGRRLPRTGKHLARENEPHLRWIRVQPCCVPGCQGKQIDAHHVRRSATSGTGLKPPDTDTVPLCRKHHDAYHRAGRFTFQARTGVDMEAIAAEMAKRSPFTR